MFDLVKITVISRLSISFHDLGLYRGQIHGVVCYKTVQVLTFVAVNKDFLVECEQGEGTGGK